MGFQVLGPVELWQADRTVDLGPMKQRTVLAALLVDLGRPVAPEVLTYRVWGDAPPAQARNVLHTYIKRLRAVLAGVELTDGVRAVELRRQPAGYVLDTDPGHVDLHLFRSLTARARANDLDDRDRLGLLREAIARWRGEPLAGIPGDWATRTRAAWHDERLDGVLRLAQLETSLGDPAAVVGPLADLAARHPLAEPVTAALMRALHAVGRGAEALDRYAATRRLLARELGVDPGPELRELHRDILRGKPVHTTTTASRFPRPAQLPGAVAGFIGRDTELARLDAMLTGLRRHATSAVISVVSGPAGVGKTSLAVHWAHRVAGRFPAGQLYVNLRGFDPTAAAVDPGEALRGFLDALGVAPERVPTGLDEQSALYRSILAGQRLLVVLDNARDADQVRPLLPGAAGCLALITSRNPLIGLVAQRGLRPLSLDVFTEAAAQHLLATRIGPDRLRDDPRAVKHIIKHCAGLPLALAVVAATATARPDVPLADLAAELRDARGGLDPFSGDDPETNARAVFSSSYRILNDPTARLFQILAAHPGPDFTVPAVASLGALSPAEASAQLAELVEAHLLTEPTAGRYAFHDLLRAYATEQANASDARTDLDDALRRLLDHYLHTAVAATHLLNRRRDPIPVGPARRGVTPENPADRHRAVTWFTAERAVLLAAIRQAADGGHDTHAWQLACALTTYLDHSGHWHDWVDSQRIAIDAAGRLADRHAQARCERSLARALVRLGSYAEASAHYHLALNLYQQLDDQLGQGHVHNDIGWVAERQGRHEIAARRCFQALELFTAAGDGAGQAKALTSIGWCHIHLHDYEQALAYCQRAIPLLSELDERGQSATWDTVGRVYHHLGDNDHAAAGYQRALELRRTAGDRYGEADTLTRLGDTRLAAGQADLARTAWQEALDILDDLGHHDADAVRTRLGVEKSRPRHDGRAATARRRV